MKNLSNEMLQKAKECKTVDELLTLAKVNDFSLTEQQATKIFNEWNKTGELSDEELCNVAGGGCGDPVGENDENLQDGEYVRFKNGYLCTNCGHHVFSLGFPWEDFGSGELYGFCMICDVPVKIFNYNDITRV